MYRNLRKLLSALLLLSLLTGCSAQQSASAQLLTQAQQTNAQRKVTQAQLGDLERTTMGLQSCKVIYVRDERIACTGMDGYTMLRCDVSNGEQVEEGQVLAWFGKVEDRRTLESLQNAVAAAEFELQSRQEAADRAVVSAETALKAAPAGSAQEEICKIRLNQAKTAAQAVSAAAVEQARQALEEYQLAVEGKALLAPFAGTVEAPLRLDGSEVTSATEFCRLYTKDQVLLRADGVNDAAYRYGATVKVNRAGKYFCEGTVISSMDVYGVVNGTVIVQMDESANLEEMKGANMGMTMSVVRLHLKDVLLLPKEAVRHDAGEYYVYLYENDTLCRRYVQIGAEGRDTQGNACLQIIDGLRAGDWVVVD